jgi:hypothetical protein
MSSSSSSASASAPAASSNSDPTDDKYVYFQLQDPGDPTVTRVTLDNNGLGAFQLEGENLAFQYNKDNETFKITNGMSTRYRIFQRNYDTTTAVVQDIPLEYHDAIIDTRTNNKYTFEAFALPLIGFTAVIISVEVDNKRHDEREMKEIGFTLMSQQPPLQLCTECSIQAEWQCNEDGTNFHVVLTSPNAAWQEYTPSKIIQPKESNKIRNGQLIVMHDWYYRVYFHTDMVIQIVKDAKSSTGVLLVSQTGDSKAIPFKPYGHISAGIQYGSNVHTLVATRELETNHPSFKQDEKTPKGSQFCVSHGSFAKIKDNNGQEMQIFSGSLDFIHHIQKSTPRLKAKAPKEVKIRPTYATENNGRENITIFATADYLQDNTVVSLDLSGGHRIITTTPKVEGFIGYSAELGKYTLNVPRYSTHVKKEEEEGPKKKAETTLDRRDPNESMIMYDVLYVMTPKGVLTVNEGDCVTLEENWQIFARTGSFRVTTTCFVGEEKPTSKTQVDYGEWVQLVQKPPPSMFTHIRSTTLGWVYNAIKHRNNAIPDKFFFRIADKTKLVQTFTGTDRVAQYRHVVLSKHTNPKNLIQTLSIENKRTHPIKIHRHDSITIELAPHTSYNEAKDGDWIQITHDEFVQIMFQENPGEIHQYFPSASSVVYFATVNSTQEATCEYTPHETNKPTTIGSKKLKVVVYSVFSSFFVWVQDLNGCTLSLIGNQDKHAHIPPNSDGHVLQSDKLYQIWSGNYLLIDDIKGGVDDDEEEAGKERLVFMPFDPTRRTVSTEYTETSWKPEYPPISHRPPVVKTPTDPANGDIDIPKSLEDTTIPKLLSSVDKSLVATNEKAFAKQISMFHTETLPQHPIGKQVNQAVLAAIHFVARHPAINAYANAWHRNAMFYNSLFIQKYVVIKEDKDKLRKELRSIGSDFWLDRYTNMVKDRNHRLAFQAIRCLGFIHSSDADQKTLQAFAIGVQNNDPGKNSVPSIVDNMLREIHTMMRTIPISDPCIKSFTTTPSWYGFNNNDEAKPESITLDVFKFENGTSKTAVFLEDHINFGLIGIHNGVLFIPLRLPDTLVISLNPQKRPRIVVCNTTLNVAGMATYKMTARVSQKNWVDFLSDATTWKRITIDKNSDVVPFICNSERAGDLSYLSTKLADIKTNDKDVYDSIMTRSFNETTQLDVDSVLLMYERQS